MSSGAPEPRSSRGSRCASLPKPGRKASPSRLWSRASLPIRTLRRESLGFVVVDDVNLDVRKGEMVAGPTATRSTRRRWTSCTPACGRRSRPGGDRAVGFICIDTTCSGGVGGDPTRTLTVLHGPANGRGYRRSEAIRTSVMHGVRRVRSGRPWGRARRMRSERSVMQGVRRVRSGP
jgi:hypothetical protein